MPEGNLESEMLDLENLSERVRTENISVGVESILEHPGMVLGFHED